MKCIFCNGEITGDSLQENDKGELCYMCDECGKLHFIDIIKEIGKN